MFGVWELAAKFGWVDVHLAPPPSHVLRALYELTVSGDLARDVRESWLRLVLGLCVGVLCGVVIGLLTGRLRPVDSMLTPIIQFLRPLPPVALIPLMIVWFGIGNPAKVVAIAVAVFFPVWVGTHLGARSVAREYLWSAQLLTRSPTRIVAAVVFPAALPMIVTGVRTAIPVAFVMVYVSELAGASAGLGYEIAVSHLAYRIDRMLAALLLLGASGAITDALFGVFARWRWPWLTRVQ
jgi:ABC-type nitrate/sulfonate/bicarbonate transport system permease component